MGKGHGEHPPRKFVGDQYFCEVCIFGFMAASISLSSLSAGMDDGGTFPYQYFFTGFILGAILLVNLISRIYVVNAVEKKGVTRKNIIKILTKTTIGNIIWPWTCRVGMLWCIPGILLTAIGGVNCGIDKKENNTVVVRNTCYYDIEGERGDMYRGLAIGLLVVHIFSFIYLLLSNCPVHTVLEQIKEDPKPARNNTNRPNAQPSTNTTAPAASTSANSTSASANTNGASAAGTRNTRELVETIERLETRIREIENRETTRVQAFSYSGISEPPPYSQLMEETSIENNSRTHPV
ncbi:uncharacterized protein LOC132755787 [Ruditapes philippinarum]|uniref:uncharacterized protein LOC132755787 n=1 Tax=Ruditapes philippinarum TaxID=129788 RepID=UPI00295C2DB1|nr:uncharacterized protein LOC132755787 [Ruditapes philippinarum]